MTDGNCIYCKHDLTLRPPIECPAITHWATYSAYLEAKLEMKDEDRDKYDVADWLETYQKTTGYTCRACGRDYLLPTHLTIFTCVCGRRCRLRHVGGTNPDHAVIDAAVQYFGTERMAQLAYIAEIIGGKYCDHYSGEEIRKMIRQELDRWEMTNTGWEKKKK